VDAAMVIGTWSRPGLQGAGSLPAPEVAISG